MSNSNFVSLLWNGVPRSFELNKLEEAWLIYSECQGGEDMDSMDQAISCSDRLRNELNWSRANSFAYTIAMK